MTTARSRAIAAESREIEASQQRAIAARETEAMTPRRMSAIESMSMRLGVTEKELQEALVETVFKDCQNRAQFLALIAVANEYKLNPLTKEIYAFPAKGGGVVPMVSVDGWIRLMNTHPMFDGIEFDYHTDAKGNIEAIESIIYRKDRSRPVKVIEYLEECERPTDPWRKTKRRMLRHRALIQGVRVAFGFSGIYAPEDEDLIEANYTVSDAPILPTSYRLAEEVSGQREEPETIDPDTGEVFETDARGMTEVDEDTARALDDAPPEDPNRARAEAMAARIEADFGKCRTDERRLACYAHYRDAIGKLEDAYPDLYDVIAPLIPAEPEANDGTFDPESNPSAAEGPAEKDRGEAHTDADEDPVTSAVNGIRASIAAAKNLNALGRIETDWTNRVMNGVSDDELIRRVDGEFTAKRRELKHAEG